jgi:phosphotransferase system enzyme I (PtsI)
VPPDSIVVSKRLLPSDTVYLKYKNVKGIIVEEGSVASHSAILARALGVPAISGLDRLVSEFTRGEELLLLGDEGVVIVNPTDEEKSQLERTIDAVKKAEEIIVKKSKEAALTKTGEKVAVYANVAFPEDFEVALLKGCDGIGLYRIEQIYMSSPILPDEKDMVEHFNKNFNKVKDKKITFRLLDIGGDKKLPYVDIDEENSPYFGLRGVRILLKHINLLKAQLRVAIFLGKSYKIRILIPMVTLPEEVKKVREIAEECRIELEREKEMPFDALEIGSMIETPSSVVNIMEIAELSDFLSIGTNDLIQYTMAACREDAKVAYYYGRGAEVVQVYIKEVVKAANRFKIECSICGELAGDMNWTEKLLKTGIRHFSVSPYSIPKIKDKIRQISV